MGILSTVFRVSKATPVVLATSFVGVAALGQVPALDKDQVIQAVNIFSRCEGTYRVVAEVLEATGDKAQAEYIRTFANGAASAAMYLLGQEHALSGKEPRPYGDFMPHIEEISELEQLRLRAGIEAGVEDILKKALEACTAIRPQ